jgi:TonB-dependent receptor
LAPDHQVGFTYLFSQNGEDQARLRVGPASLDNLEKGDISYLNELHWTERNLNTYQMYGKHLFPELGGVGMNWLYSLANTTQDEPDYRLFNYTQTPQGSIIVSGSSGAPEPSGGPTRYFRDLEEDTSTFKLDFTAPFRAWQYLGGEVKFGGYMSSSDREFSERTYTFRPSEGGFSGDPFAFANNFLTDQRLTFHTNFARGIPRSYAVDTPFTDELGNSSMTGSQDIEALYAMGTIPVVEKLRLIGGARVEKTDLQVESVSRLLGEGTGLIDETDVLPAAGFIYSPRKDMNIRFNFAQTVARPTYREFSLLRSYDVTGGEIFIGNPNLVMSHIDNYDLRWEWFPRPGELVSVSLFYKDIELPIERFAVDAFKGDEITYTNFPSAKVYGVEFEGRKSLDFLDPLLECFSVGLNYSLIKSESENIDAIMETKQKAGFDDETRPLFDQSPYIVTVDLTYDNPRLGTTITLAYSEFGERLYIVSNAGADVYEQPAPQLDLIFSQRIGRHWKFRFSAKNLLNPLFERKYGQEGELDGDAEPAEPYSSYRRGRTFTVSLGFDY